MPKTVKRKNGQLVQKTKKRRKMTMSTAVKKMSADLKGSSVPGIKMDVAPLQIYKTLKTAASAIISYSSGNAVTPVTIMVNSCHDPMQTHGAQQPAYWDQLTNELYSKYRCWKGVIKCSFNSIPVNGNQDMWIIGYLTTSPTSSTTLDQAYQQQGAIKTFLKANNNNSTEYSNNNVASVASLEFAFSVNDFFSKNDIDYTVYTSDPANTLYLQLALCAADLGNFDTSNAGTVILVELVQLVQFQRHTLPAPVS